MKLFTKVNNEPEMIFNIQENQSFINAYKDSLVHSAETYHVEAILRAFNKSVAVYDGLRMGEFSSHSELYISKEKASFSVEEIKKIEIEHYIEQLSKFKVSLVTVSNSRLTNEEKSKVLRLVENIKDDFDLKKKLFTTRRIPISDLNVQENDVAFIKKHEKYIISIVLLYMYDYESLNNFIAMRR